MSGLLIEAHDWPEDVRPLVRDVEMRLLKRAILHYPSTLSTPEPAARVVNPSPFGSAPAGQGTTVEVIA